VFLLAAVIALAQPALAERVIEATAPAARPACDAREADELRAHLESQARKAHTWNWAWRITFTSAVAGTLALGLANPLPELQGGLYVSAGKATVGALARWFLPLRIDVPLAQADTCADVTALRAAVATAARRQRRLFYLGHAGGILVNVAGAWILTEYESFNKGLLSVAIGYPIGLLSNYTMSRGSWQFFRDRGVTWTVTVLPQRDGWGFGLAGSF
jgi:hypothetical protein